MQIEEQVTELRKLLKAVNKSCGALTYMESGTGDHARINVDSYTVMALEKGIELLGASKRVRDLSREMTNLESEAGELKERLNTMRKILNGQG